MKAPTTPLPTVLQPEHLALGRVYAEALADGAAGELEPLAEELDQLLATIAGVDGAMDMLAAPHQTLAERDAMIDRIFSDRVCPPLVSLLRVMARNGRLALLPAVARAFRQVLDERAGRVEVLVTTAVPMDEELLDSVRKQVTDMIGQEPVLHCRVDRDIVGGLILQIGDRVYDASVAGELKRMTDSVAKSLAEARLRRHRNDEPDQKGDDSQ
jgi:F-type H+-transporting ATPase subunit delta